jgi:glutamyl-tRNA synthetase
MRNEQRAAGENPRYDGRCRDRREPRPGVAPVVRFKNPLHRDVLLDDRILGEIRVANEQLDDLIIARSDGTPAYNFTVVVESSIFRENDGRGSSITLATDRMND